MKTVAVSGFFDPLHFGHIELFEKASKLGEKLIVILNSDHQAKLKKGKAFMPEEERKKILESIKFVDKVIISIDKDGSQCKTLSALKPDIFANGGDRFNYEIPEAKVCIEAGIKIVDGLGKKVQSSSKLLKDAEAGK
jgi:cytidyltransferase-like protein